MAARRTSGRRIGELAAVAGVSVDTLRYYERAGVLPKAARTDGGFRVYPSETTERLRFIKQSQQLGLSLRDIRQLLGGDNRRCGAVRDMIVKQLADVDDRVRELRSFRRMLSAALEECDRALRRSKDAECPVAPQLGSRRR